MSQQKKQKVFQLSYLRRIYWSYSSVLIILLHFYLSFLLIISVMHQNNKKADSSHFKTYMSIKHESDFSPSRINPKEPQKQHAKENHETPQPKRPRGKINVNCINL